MDALLQYYLKECRRFQNDYRTVQIDNVPKGYQEDCLYLNEIKSKLPSRSEYENAKYQVIFKEILEKVGIIYRKWDTARLELNKKLAEENRKRTIQFYTILFSAITAGGTILGLILKLL